MKKKTMKAKRGRKRTRKVKEEQKPLWLADWTASKKLFPVGDLLQPDFSESLYYEAASQELTHDVVRRVLGKFLFYAPGTTALDPEGMLRSSVVTRVGNPLRRTLPFMQKQEAAGFGRGRDLQLDAVASALVGAASRSQQAAALVAPCFTGAGIPLQDS